MYRWQKKLHSSWLVMWLSLACIVGIILSALPDAPPASTAWLVIGIALTCAGFANRYRTGILVIIIAGLCIGLWRGSIEQHSLHQYRNLYGTQAVVTGVLSEDASYGTRGDQRITLKHLQISGKSFVGNIWVSLGSPAQIRRSDSVTVEGILSPGFGSFAGSIFRARVVTTGRPSPGDVGLQLRDWFASGIRKAIPEPEASLASGYLIGEQTSLPADLDAELKTVGLTHAVVASGYNLTVLVSVGRQVLASISKYLATLAAGSMIIIFIMMSGLSPSMSRAGLVTSLSLAAWYYGRTFHPIVLLAIAAATTLLFNPMYVWGDIGWYLSFASFAGIIILAPLLTHALWRPGQRPGFVAQIIIDTLSAQLATLPIIVFTFGHYSPYALLANILVLPLVPLTMLLSFVASLAGSLIPVIAHVAGWPAYAILHYMTTVIAWVAELPGAQGSLGLGLAGLTTVYLVLLCASLWLWRLTRYDFRSSEEPEPVD